MQDGKGALYFVKPQATKMTRQDMRDTSPSGAIDMSAWMGRRWVIIAMKAMLTVCIVGLTVNALI